MWYLVRASGGFGGIGGCSGARLGRAWFDVDLRGVDGDGAVVLLTVANNKDVRTRLPIGVIARHATVFINYH